MSVTFHTGRRPRIPGIVLGVLAGAASAGNAGAQPERDPCRLLSDAEVRAVQGHTPAQKVPSEQPAGSFRFMQCFYRTPDFASSVSVAVGVPLPSDASRSGPRDYWRQRFHGQVAAPPGRKKKEPPTPMPDVGDEAFWVGDPVTGALYVLKGDLFLRLSVGGRAEAEKKTERARILASHALKRLDTRGGRPPS